MKNKGAIKGEFLGQDTKEEVKRSEVHCATLLKTKTLIKTLLPLAIMILEKRNCLIELQEI